MTTDATRGARAGTLARGLYQAKPWFVGRLRPIEDRLVAAAIHPDALTRASLGAAAMSGGAVLAGAWTSPAWWLALPLLGVARLAAAALDGAVARRTGLCSARGAVRNELADRAGDVLTFAPLAAVAPIGLVTAALVGALGTAFLGVLAALHTGRRDTGGPMGKADRIALMGVTGIAASLWGPPAFGIALVVTTAGCAATVGLRLRRLLQAVAT